MSELDRDLLWLRAALEFNIPRPVTLEDVKALVQDTVLDPIPRNIEFWDSFISIHSQNWQGIIEQIERELDEYWHGGTHG